MKRIIILSILLLAVLFPTTQAQDELDYTQFDTLNENNLDAQNAVRINQILTKLDQIDVKSNQCFKTNEIPQLKQQLNEDMAQKFNELIGNSLAVQIIWSAFFFAVLFWFKSKGWL